MRLLVQQLLDYSLVRYNVVEFSLDPCSMAQRESIKIQ